MPQYKVRNWPQYNESLKKRGSISLWISEDATKKWRSPKDPYFIDAPQQYLDDAIFCLKALKVVFKLLFRQVIGLVLSLFTLMRLVLKVPHFTTVAARARGLGKHFNKLSKRTPTVSYLTAAALRFMEKASGRLDSMVSKREGDGRNFIVACVRKHMKSLLQKSQS